MEVTAIRPKPTLVSEILPVGVSVRDRNLGEYVLV